MQWMIVICIAAIFVLTWCCDSYRLGERRYRLLLKSRSPINEEELLRQFFQGSEGSPEIPGVVRTIVAEHIGFPPELMLPDDDLGFYAREFDQAGLVRDIESHFRIVISDQDAESVKSFTIRSISALVSRLKRQVES